MLRRSLRVTPGAGRSGYYDHCDDTTRCRPLGAVTRLALLVPPISLDSFRIHGWSRNPNYVSSPHRYHSTHGALPRASTRLSIDSRRSYLALESAAQHLLIIRRYSAPYSLYRLRSPSLSHHIYFWRNYIYRIWVRYRSFGLGETRIFKIMIFISITCIFMILWDHERQ